ncbi:hypothetical protein [Streptomyces tendae]|uniref:hypothetical protein n=1 Tax=Streptomyces tendae TaxID=1932 RepID=UPI003722899E
MGTRLPDVIAEGFVRLTGIRRKRYVLAPGLLAVATVLGVAPAAAALDTDNLYSVEACKDPGASKFKFHIYYNSGLNGSYRNIGYAVYNFNDVPDGVVGVTSALRFCQIGASAPWPGSNQLIKNNAASGENDHYKYYANVYYYSGYKGAHDIMGPYQHHDRFVNVYNENASFQFTSSAK